MLLLMGDFSAKVGRREPSTTSSAIGLYSLGERNEAGEQLEDFCLEQEMALAMFKQHQGGCMHGPLLMATPGISCAKMENKLDELSHVSRSRLRHRSSVARGDCESQAG